MTNQLSRRAIACACLAMFAAGALAQGLVTIGRGPELGTTAGETWFEDFQDWPLSACKALDEAQDSFDFGDGREGSRDLLAFYFLDDPAANAVYFRADFLELGFGAESDSLDLYVSIDFGTPASGQEFLPDFTDCQTDTRWEVTVSLYSGEFWNIYDQNFNVLSSHDANQQLFLGAHYRSDLDAVEFGVDRSVLLGQGWDGASPLNFQVYTTRDGTQDGPGEIPGASDVTDALVDDERGATDGFLNGAISSADAVRGVRYAYILHANQAISQADAIQKLIRSSSIATPAGNPTGYARALDTAEIFDAAPNLHLSGSLLSACLWADLPGAGDPSDGPEFVKRVGRLIDGTPGVRGAGALIGGVYSENIMPYFEGAANQAFIGENEKFLAKVFGVSHPQAETVFWIPERVARGTTFADLSAAGYGWTVLDQINHLREWFGETAADAQGHKIHRINGVDCFMINDGPDRFKFANTDGGLWFDTRLLLAEMALDPDGQQLVLVFDDWEAYAGRSFGAFDTGTDNPDNWNRNVRWIANHPWIRVSTLEEIAALGWAPVLHPANPALPVEAYDYLDHATEGSYDNWYFGSSLEESFADAFPPRRSDFGADGDKRMGAQDEPGTVIGDLVADVVALGEGPLADLARLNLATGTFETAWHDEDQTGRCPDGTYDCYEDDTFDPIAGFARRLQFRALREAGFGVRAAEWAAGSPPAGSGTAAQVQFADFDHDGENEAALFNDSLLAIFENDGGRLVALYARRPDGYAAQVIGNPLGFPDFEDERESGESGRFRTSALVDWNSNTGDRTNAIYFVETFGGMFQTASADGAVTRSIALAPNSTELEVTYSLASGTNSVRVRHGLVADLLSLTSQPRSILEERATAERFVLYNPATGVGVGIDHSGPGHNAAFDPSPENVGANGSSNQAMTRVVETSGGQGLSFAIVVELGEVVVPETGSTGLLLR